MVGKYIIERFFLPSHLEPNRDSVSPAAGARAAGAAVAAGIGSAKLNDFVADAYLRLVSRRIAGPQQSGLDLLPWNLVAFA